MRYKHTLLNWGCWTCARMRFHCASCLVVLRMRTFEGTLITNTFSNELIYRGTISNRIKQLSVFADSVKSSELRPQKNRFGIVVKNCSDWHSFAFLQVDRIVGPQRKMPSIYSFVTGVEVAQCFVRDCSSKHDVDSHERSRWCLCLSGGTEAKRSKRMMPAFSVQKTRAQNISWKTDFTGGQGLT